MDDASQQAGAQDQPLRIDFALLDELGLGLLSQDDKARMIAHMYESLELRVGMKLAKAMNEQQLREFEGFIDSNQQKEALAWLEANFPSYKDVVREELEGLKAEIKRDAAKILENMNDMGPSGAESDSAPQPGQ